MLKKSLVLAVACLLAGAVAGWWMSGKRDGARKPPTVLRPQTGASATLPEQVRSPRGNSLEPRTVRPMTDPPLAASTGAARDTGERDDATRNAPSYEQAPEEVVGRPGARSVRADPGLVGDSDDDARRRQEDFEAYGDGPVTHPQGANPTDPDREEKAGPQDEDDTCLPLGSPGCRRDRDCCGPLVCRSQPGTISGFWECMDR